MGNKSHSRVRRNGYQHPQRQHDDSTHSQRHLYLYHRFERFQLARLGHFIAVQQFESNKAPASRIPRGLRANRGGNAAKSIPRFRIDSLTLTQPPHNHPPRSVGRAQYIFARLRLLAVCTFTISHVSLLRTLWFYFLDHNSVGVGFPARQVFRRRSHEIKAVFWHRQRNKLARLPQAWCSSPNQGPGLGTATTFIPRRCSGAYRRFRSFRRVVIAYRVWPAHKRRIAENYHGSPARAQMPPKYPYGRDVRLPRSIGPPIHPPPASSTKPPNHRQRRHQCQGSSPAPGIASWPTP